MFQKYQDTLKLMLAFLEEHIDVHPIAGELVARITRMGRQMEFRIDIMKAELHSAHQVLLVSLNRNLAPGEIPFDLSEEWAGLGGGFADVHIGWWRPIGQSFPSVKDPQRVAIKHIRWHGIDQNTTETAAQERLQKRINREMECWKMAMEHPHVLSFFAFSYSPHPILIAPWCKNGHMRGYLGRNPSANKMTLLMQVAHGLDFLHTRQPPIVHGDIKPDNILIGDAFEALIADFGLSKVKRDISSGWTTDFKPVILWYTAPELLDEGEITSASDVYAFTIMVLEILSGRQPFSGRVGMPLGLAVLRGERPKLEDHPVHPYNLRGLFESGWHCDLTRRPSMAVIWGELRATAGSNTSESVSTPTHIHMPIPFSTIMELDEMVNPMMGNSRHHSGGMDTAPIHCHTETKNTSADGGITVPYNLPEPSVQTTWRPPLNSHSTAYRSHNLSEGSTGWYQGNSSYGTQRRFTGPDPSMRARGMSSHGQASPLQGFGSMPHAEGITSIHQGEASDIWLADYQVGTHGPPMRVAVKYFRRLESNTQGEFVFENLIARWRVWYHPFILPLWHAEASPAPMIVTPWNRNGSLANYLRSVGAGSSVRYRLLAQIADGLAYLHSDKAGPTTHGRLQLGCIYVDDDGNARIGGFGVFLPMLDGHQHMVRSAWRDVRYKAPEILEGFSQTPAGDVYALSMMGVEILSGCRPFNSLDGLKLAVAVTSGARPRMENHLEPSGRCQALWGGFEEMWDQDPEERPSAEEVHRGLRLSG
ncbi:hypothetical protein FRB95_001528 [Tulasnella sp. JGI-2019a]|nr:hypothetical protein FRB95_001528 [Tulasnella sp. JGI-2019a]